MPKVFTSKTQKIGEIGENIAVRFLVKHDYKIIERNYTRKWGEIDIIAKKHNIIYFIEVKSVLQNLEMQNDVSHETFRPEENMHENKIKRLNRAIQTYLMDKDLENTDWQTDLILVYIDMDNKKAKVNTIENIIS